MCWVQTQLMLTCNHQWCFWLETKLFIHVLSCNSAHHWCFRLNFNPLFMCWCKITLTIDVLGWTKLTVNVSCDSCVTGSMPHESDLGPGVQGNCLRRNCAEAVISGCDAKSANGEEGSKFNAYFAGPKRQHVKKLDLTKPQIDRHDYFLSYSPWLRRKAKSSIRPWWQMTVQSSRKQDTNTEDYRFSDKKHVFIFLDQVMN